MLASDDCGFLPQALFKHMNIIVMQYSTDQFIGFADLEIAAFPEGGGN
jgi:hypothetical protein